MKILCKTFSSEKRKHAAPRRGEAVETGGVAENFLAKHTRYTELEAVTNGGEGAWQPETEPKPVSDM